MHLNICGRFKIRHSTLLTHIKRMVNLTGPLPISFRIVFRVDFLSIFHMQKNCMTLYSKTSVKRPLSKRSKNGFQDKLSLNACQKYCRMLQGILQSFRHSLSYHLPFRSLFCLFLNCRFTHILLYFHLRLWNLSSGIVHNKSRVYLKSGRKI